jgi:hypothetical protein
MGYKLLSRLPQSNSISFEEGKWVFGIVSAPSPWRGITSFPVALWKTSYSVGPASPINVSSKLSFTTPPIFWKNSQVWEFTLGCRLKSELWSSLLYNLLLPINIFTPRLVVGTGPWHTFTCVTFPFCYLITWWDEGQYPQLTLSSLSQHPSEGFSEPLPLDLDQGWGGPASSVALDQGTAVEPWARLGRNLCA